ncbi:MAG: hypothetical protein WCO82_08425 [Sphingomonadales bacterium]|jgi:hypothetical protein
MVRIAICGAAAAVLAVAANSQPAETFEYRYGAGPGPAFCGIPATSLADVAKAMTPLWERSADPSHAEITFMRASGEVTIYVTMTTPSNPAHPAAFCREASSIKGKSIEHWRVICEGPRAACDAYAADLKPAYDATVSARQP